MSIIEFNFNKKSEYFTDPKIKKWRIISNILFIIGFILVFGSILIFWNNFEKIEATGIDILLQPPFPFIIAGVILFSIGSLITKIATVKAVVKSFKTNDNPFFKEKEKINNEINEKKKEFEDLKNAYDSMKSNDDNKE